MLTEAVGPRGINLLRLYIPIGSSYLASGLMGFVRVMGGEGSAKREWERSGEVSTRDCVEWDGALHRDGYGRVGKKRIALHRLVWEENFGTIPEGLCVLHRCDNPSCINVDHLFLGTQRDNNQDRIRKGRTLHGREHPNSKKTHCPRGHELRGENLDRHALRRGKRCCRTCRNDRQLTRWRLKQMKSHGRDLPAA